MRGKRGKQNVVDTGSLFCLEKKRNSDTRCNIVESWKADANSQKPVTKDKYCMRCLKQKMTGQESDWQAGNKQNEELLMWSTDFCLAGQKKFCKWTIVIINKVNALNIIQWSKMEKIKFYIIYELSFIIYIIYEFYITTVQSKCTLKQQTNCFGTQCPCPTQSWCQLHKWSSKPLQGPC